LGQGISAFRGEADGDRRPSERPQIVAFYNQRGKAEQYIKEGKYAIKWTRLSCGKFRNNEVRLQLHVLAYNLANFMRTLALPKEVEHWSLTPLREMLVKIGAKVVSHGRYVTFQVRADYQNYAIGWLQKGHSSGGGGTVVQFPRI